MDIIKGISSSPGISFGKILYYSSIREDFSSEPVEDVSKEISLLEKGLKNVNEMMEQDISFYYDNNRKQEGILLEARKLLLNDIITTGECYKLIQDKKYCACQAVHEASTKIRIQFEDMQDDFMRERAEDIKYVSNLLLNELGVTKNEFPHLTEPSIIVADELIPEGTICFEKDMIKGIVINHGSYNSHSSILARLWQIPALLGITPEKKWNNLPCVIDGNEGILYINPSDEIIQRAKLSNMYQ
ncbi:MAG: phosphoenolpyruvate-utilizing N-terminal domain-containing protein [Agathobacter sp.]|nr:phosphoenolpyruvate-utilizing N-terminal domain-containing protein [Agathobacter sp.]